MYITTKNLIALYIKGSLFVFFLILSFVVDTWFLVGVVFSMFIIGQRFEIIAKDDWNAGINKKYNKPWEFKEYGCLPSGKKIFMFECKEEFLSMKRKEMKTCFKTYKGKNKIKGL